MTDELVEFVLEQTSRPLDRWAVAALLESGGIRDLDARERFGRRDVFDLAEHVYARCLDAERQDVPETVRLLSWKRRALEGAGRFLRGGFFFVQLALQFGSLALLGYGQWASLAFTGRQASIIGVALLASFLVAGAFVQPLGYLGPYFAVSGKNRLVWRVISAVVVLGIGGLGVGALTAWLANLFTSAYDGRSFATGLVYYTLAGCVAIAGGVLYVLKQYIAMLVCTVAGIAVVGIVLHHTGLGIYGAHWLGLGTTTVTEGVWAAAVLAHRARATTPEMRGAQLPPRPVLIAAALPYALYGAGYFALVFADRLAAWSTGSHGFPFTFRSGYEVGLDWALISVVPALAMLEVTIHAFSARLESAGTRHLAEGATEHNAELQRFYRRYLAILALLLIAGASVTFGLGRLVIKLELTKLHSLFSSPTTLHVYPIAVAGYALLVWGLFNGLFLFSLGRPWLVLRALLPGVVVAVTIAVVLAHTIVYWAAAGGFVVGALVFALSSSVITRRVLASVDYYYAAAY